MFVLIWGSRRRVIDAGRGAYHCPVCKRLQPFALKRIARYFTLFFIPIARSGAAIEYAVCLGCNNALKRATLEAAPLGTPSTSAPALEAVTKPIPSADAPQAAAAPLPAAPRPAAAVACSTEPPCAAARPAFGQSAFAKATYARQRRPAPGFGTPAPSGPAFFTPRR